MVSRDGALVTLMSIGWWFGMSIVRKRGPRGEEEEKDDNNDAPPASPGAGGDNGEWVLVLDFKFHNRNQQFNGEDVHVVLRCMSQYSLVFQVGL